jgi:hypothetical protein
VYSIGIDGVLWALGFIAQLLLICILVRRRLSTVFPWFTMYLCLGAVGDPFVYWVLHVEGDASQIYRTVFVASNVLDYALQVMVLLEVGANVLFPIKRLVPKFSRWAAVFALSIAVCLAFWLLSPSHSIHPRQILSLFLRLSLTLVLLRLAVFGAVAGFAQLLGVGWRNYVLQLTTGLAFYGIVTVAIQFLSDHWEHVLAPATFAVRYHLLNRFQIGAYLVTLGFWIWAFSQNEAPRKEFSPQMQAFLVSIAGTARSARLAVTRGTGR